MLLFHSFFCLFNDFINLVFSIVGTENKLNFIFNCFVTI